MRKLTFFCLTGVAAAAASPALAQADFYGGASASGIYSNLSGDQGEDDINGSAVVGRGYGGLRFNPKGNTTRLQASSTYYAYLEDGRKDRWSNGVELEQTMRFGNGFTLGLEAAAATNVWTLEAQSADQIAGYSRLAYEPNRQHRFEVSAGLRRRSYDGRDAHGTSPIFGAEYRYRIAANQYVLLQSSIESVESNYDPYDHKRFTLAGFYSHPLADRGNTRLRAGLAYRRWRWDERFAPGGNELRDSSVTPQIRLIHGFSPATDIELDYRRIFRRSNDDSRDRNGNRLALSLRTVF